MRNGVWSPALAVIVAVAVGSSVLLISVAYGAADSIKTAVSQPEVRHSGLVNVEEIDSILRILTVVITATSVILTTVAALIVSLMVVKSKSLEIAERLGRGVNPRTLTVEHVLVLIKPGIKGGVVGEAAAIFIGRAIHQYTDLPVALSEPVLIAALPIAVASVIGAAIVASRSATHTDIGLLE